MDRLAGTLREYPPDKPARISHSKHDVIARRFAHRLIDVFKENEALLQQNAAIGGLLETIQPGVHTISYLGLLDYAYSRGSDPEPEEIHPYLLRLLAEFDVIQIRFVGPTFLNLLERVSRGSVFPPQIAIKAVVGALLRLDESNQVLTSTHLAILKLAYDTNSVSHVVPILEPKVILFPGTSSESYKSLCDPTLLPQSVITVRNGLTRQLTPLAALEYYVVAGTAYTSLRLFAKAIEYFVLAVAFPSRDKTLSEMMLQAYKRWVLTNLLVHGSVPDLPASVSASVTSAFRSLSKEYLDLAAAFADSRGAASLKEESAKNAAIFASDSNTGLVAETLFAFQRRHISNLQAIYTSLPVSRVRANTQSAVTGARLETDDEVVQLIQSMIDQREINATLVQPNGTLYLQFDAVDQRGASEVVISDALKSNISRLLLVQHVSRAIAMRAETHQAYVHFAHQYAMRTAASHGNAATEPPPHMEALGEEDLMSGVGSWT